MNTNYIGDVTLESSRLDRILQFSFGLANRSKMRGAVSGRYNSFRPTFTVAPFSSGCTSESGKIKLMK